MPGPETRNSRDATQEQIFLKIPQMTLVKPGLKTTGLTIPPEVATKPQNILKRKWSCKFCCDVIRTT